MEQHETSSRHAPSEPAHESRHPEGERPQEGERSGEGERSQARREDAAGGAPADVAVVIPAYREEARIAQTVAAAATLDGVDLVVVVDDGSDDATAEKARAAGAVVVRHSRNRGKAAAMETGAAAVAAVEDVQAARARQARGGQTEPGGGAAGFGPAGATGAEAPGAVRAPRHLLFLDADLRDTAANAGPLAAPVRAGEADMTIAVLPPQKRAGGGHGFVVRLSREGIRRTTGFQATQPLSGQRCLTRAAFEAALPLAHGFGVETGLTVDLLAAGYRVREVEVEFHHRVTGTDLRSQVHRGRQFAHVALALGARELPVALAEARRRAALGARRLADRATAGRPRGGR
ncbi:glycosyltransferase family 2 protein [Allostreptomyces psammosilenae]|uniref:Glucosyl-3-phosphoglycerate synthase n=1 Tax=Allostreptomyces psammosilenae TaxID=1892865 RepID=A0A853A4S8_9ACTN|nr:glycosyltransferase [Allostreptomyces psammosilenae]NYI05498.1 hypothetical protein [Allostreptomyces psammosilenae]